MKTCDCNQGRLPCTCKPRNGTRIHNPKRGTEFAYNAGVDACDAGLPKTAPGGLGRERKSWWLAGYNDRDIELQILARNRWEGSRQLMLQVALSEAETSTLDKCDFSIIGIERMSPMEYDEP